MSGVLKFCRRNVSGATMVEFALTLPLLALILFGIIQYGFLFGAYITVRNASSVGARAYAIKPTDAAGARGLAAATVGPMLNTNTVTVTSGTVTVGGSTAYSITVSYPVPLIIPFVVPGAGSTRTLTATTINR